MAFVGSQIDVAKSGGARGGGDTKNAAGGIGSLMLAGSACGISTVGGGERALGTTCGRGGIIVFWVVVGIHVSMDGVA